MKKAPMPSFVWLPDDSRYSTCLEFLVAKFSRIPEDVWRQRIELQKVSFEGGELIELLTPYRPSSRIQYFREVVDEPIIPFQEKVLFENDRFLIVDKPHFLPIHPAGKYVTETLVSRLKEKHGYKDLAIAHRLDRLTAGLVLCTKEKQYRSAYQQLFMNKEVQKVYHAVSKSPKEVFDTRVLKLHMAPYLEHFRMQIKSDLEPNSESHVSLLESRNGKALFELSPITGKKHQLRVHMAEIGLGIVNDPLYPSYSNEEQEDNYNEPMQLLAKRLSFTDPLTNEHFSFASHQSLSL
ncbi:MAG: pseudouridine synthase [Lentisphaeraceae bacterium]|nr:pseudouridine synthase [Lentisphaeraceae bacterium]